MAPLKRLRKASDKSTEVTTVTEAATTKKRSCEVEESLMHSRFHEELFPRVQGILLIYSHIDRSGNQSYLISTKGIDQFEASIFGDFTRMKTVQFCGGFAHHLLLRQLYNDDPYVIEFEFNEVGARFDKKAFTMFTRLNCGKFPKEIEMRNLSYSLWTKYFGESGPMTQTEFGKAFKDIEFKYDNDQEIWDNVKCYVGLSCDIRSFHHDIVRSPSQCQISKDARIPIS
ncbi:hypothetical protein FNV43_RR13483 [Rhamnella rubrinervis]|uniref:Uncharacterized protein n=1 Tax=Rhamnella rubrinervis TaxID=2594499 RepID=A0A8K0H194_9ROSA|nr:hypothetical protein FNV43_RR13483 [Rhamnella rubrinervis]